MKSNKGRNVSPPKSSVSKDGKFWVKTVSLIVVCLLALMYLWSLIPNKCFLPGFCQTPEKITIGVLTLDKDKQLPDFQALAEWVYRLNHADLALTYPETFAEQRFQPKMCSC
jgi:hypothetical protein